MKIALNMIMKNEEKVISRLLESVLPIIDCYCILDTGSTDNSIQIVKDFFDKHNIQGEIHVNTECVEIIEGETCFIYNKARNAALKLLEGKADFGFFIDCDEELVLSPDFKIDEFKYKLNQFDLGCIAVSGTAQYGRRSFFRVSKPFHWIGKIHEMIVCGEQIKEHYVKGLTVKIHFDTTDTDINKFKKHALVLQQSVNETGTPRDIFYLANSYKDAGDFVNAIKYYKRRIAILEGFPEERYYSQFMIGNLYRTYCKPFYETLIEFLKCSELDIMRAEHLLNAIIILQNNNLWQTSYVLSKDAVEKFHQKNPYPNRVLFIQENVYTNRLLDAHLINCKVLNMETQWK